jgi:hypothetical protein
VLVSLGRKEREVKTEKEMTERSERTRESIEPINRKETQMIHMNFFKSVNLKAQPRPGEAEVECGESQNGIVIPLPN